ncbi:MAG: ubiquitin-like domain-containing protein, partial [Clostridia bacterium]|nr:ubiquitin-like domain-containing protein [Clostridia bacterium]
MKREEKASISIIKIICVSIILILISGIGVMAVNTNLKDIKIILQNGYEMTALTSKTTVSEVLEENNIVLKEDQKTIPDLDSEISAGQNIQITDKSYNEVKIAKISEEGAETTLEQLLQNYAPITEKIVVEQVAIPYETITKNSTSADSNTTNK